MSRLRFMPVLVGALLLHSAVLAAQQAPARRVLASFNGDSVQTFNASPDGRFVALSTTSELRMYEVATRQSWHLADGEGWELSWSPRGDRIAWVRGGDDGSGEYVWTMEVDARTGKARGPAQRVTIGQGEFPSFSPDGRLLAFAAIDSGGGRNLSVVPVTGGPERVVARFSSFFEGTYWSTDGRTIYTWGPTPGDRANTYGMLKIRVDGGAPEMIRRGSEWPVGMTADRRHFIVVPAKARVAAGDQATVIDTAGREVGHVPLPVGDEINYDAVLGDSAFVWLTITDRRTLEVRPVAGGSARRLPLVGESNDAPLWSPDGTRIAFRVSENSRTSLAVMNADGSNPRVFREAEVEEHPLASSWSPDSRFVAFRSPDTRRLSLLDVAAGTVRTVLDDSIGGWAWRSDGQTILFRSRRSVGAGIAEVTLNGGRRQLLDWPVPATSTNWRFVGDSSIFVYSDTGVVLRPLGPGPARHLADRQPGSQLYFPALSHDGRRIAGLLERGSASGVTRNQVELFSLETGARTVLDLPFDWVLRWYISPPEFLPGDTSVLAFGRRSGESDITLYRVPLDGSTPRAFANVGAPRQGSVVLAASTSPDGQWVAYSVQPEPATLSLVLIDLRGAIPRATSRAPSR